MVDFPIDEVDYPSALDGQLDNNGQLPASILQTVGAVTLLKDSSMRGWLAMQHAAGLAGVTLRPTSPPDTYRTYAEQVTLFKERYVPYYKIGVTTTHSKTWAGKRWWLLLGEAPAATPGSSNHGYALAIDVDDAEAPARQQWLLANAQRYGFSWEL